MLSFPQGLEEGKVYSGMVRGVDIYPTCAGLCQVKVDASVQGMDLSGAIDTTGGSERGEAYIQWVGRGRFRFATIHIELYAQSGTLTWWVVTNYEDPYQMDNLYHKLGGSSLRERLHLRLVRTILHAGESRPDFI